MPSQGTHNNICERILKRAILHRKNSLFFRTARGARVADIFMTLIQTAELAKKDPLHYLTTLLEHHEQVAASPGDWLPWNYEQTVAASQAVAAGLAAPTLSLASDRPSLAPRLPHRKLRLPLATPTRTPALAKGDSIRTTG